MESEEEEEEEEEEEKNHFSITFVPSRFHFHKEKFGEYSINDTISIFKFFFQMRKSETALKVC